VCCLPPSACSCQTCGRCCMDALGGFSCEYLHVESLRARVRKAAAPRCRIPEWEEKGIKVVKVFAERGEGYVQDAFASDKKLQDGAKACVLLCGQKEMAFAVKDMLTAEGVPEDRFLTNF
jgi:ferredoxin-NADP reductase